MDCKYITSRLHKEGATKKDCKRTKKSRTVSPEEQTGTLKNTYTPVHVMPVISELERENSSFTSSEKSENHPRRKRAVLLLPSLTKEMS